MKQGRRCLVKIPFTQHFLRCAFLQSRWQSLRCCCQVWKSLIWEQRFYLQEQTQVQCWRVTKYIYSATAYLSILEAKTELKLFRLRFYIKTYDDLIKYSVLFRIKAVTTCLWVVSSSNKLQIHAEELCFFYIYLINHLTPPQIYFVNPLEGPNL